MAGKMGPCGGQDGEWDREVRHGTRRGDYAMEQAGVDSARVRNWEGSWTAPDLRAMPAVIPFLGGNPAWERVVRRRVSAGVSLK